MEECASKKNSNIMIVYNKIYLKFSNKTNEEMNKQKQGDINLKNLYVEDVIPSGIGPLGSTQSWMRSEG